MCIYIYIYTCIYIYIYIYIHTYTHAHTHPFGALPKAMSVALRTGADRLTPFNLSYYDVKLLVSIILYHCIVVSCNIIALSIIWFDSLMISYHVRVYMHIYIYTHIHTYIM